jgi:hypothetical protein
MTRSARNRNLIQIRAAYGGHNIHGPTCDEINPRVGPQHSQVDTPARTVARDLRRYYNLLAAGLDEAALTETEQTALTAAAVAQRPGPGIPHSPTIVEFLPSAIDLLAKRADGDDAAVLAGVAECAHTWTPLAVYAVQDFVEQAMNRAAGVVSNLGAMPDKAAAS